jgi:hypothetical protein
MSAHGGPQYLRSAARLNAATDVESKTNACLECVRELSQLAGSDAALRHTYSNLHTLFRRLVVVHPDLVRSKSLVPFPSSFEQILTLQHEHEEQLAIAETLKKKKNAAAKNGEPLREDDENRLLFDGGSLPDPDLVNELNPDRHLFSMEQKIRARLRALRASSSSSSSSSSPVGASGEPEKRTAISSAAFDALTKSLLQPVALAEDAAQQRQGLEGGVVLYKTLATRLNEDNARLNIMLEGLQTTLAATDERTKRVRDEIETLKESNRVKHMQTVVYSNKENAYESRYESIKRKVDHSYSEMELVKKEGDFLDLERDVLQKKMEHRNLLVESKHKEAEQKNMHAFDDLEDMSDTQMEGRLVDLMFRCKEANKQEQVLTAEWTGLEKDRENLVTQVDILEQAVETMHLMTDEFVEADETGTDATGKIINTNVPDSIAALLPAMRNKRLLTDAQNIVVNRRGEDSNSSDAEDCKVQLLAEKNAKGPPQRQRIKCYGRAAHVPAFLRFDGSVVDLEMNKGHVELIVKEIWALKTMRDHDRQHHGLAPLSLSEFFQSYLALRFPEEEKFMEFSYSFIAAARKNTYGRSRVCVCDYSSVMLAI